jgi:hypothetical protein
MPPLSLETPGSVAASRPRGLAFAPARLAHPADVGFHARPVLPTARRVGGRADSLATVSRAKRHPAARRRMSGAGGRLGDAEAALADPLAPSGQQRVRECVRALHVVKRGPGAALDCHDGGEQFG